MIKERKEYTVYSWYVPVDLLRIIEGLSAKINVPEDEIIANAVKEYLGLKGDANNA